MSRRWAASPRQLYYVINQNGRWCTPILAHLDRQWRCIFKGNNLHLGIRRKSNKFYPETDNFLQTLTASNFRHWGHQPLFTNHCQRYSCASAMFARPRPKKSPLPPPSKKRKNTSAIEEISFDTDARQEYLTGFHKRKLQRIKSAQEEAAKKARQEKLEARKQVCPTSLGSCHVHILTCTGARGKEARR